MLSRRLLLAAIVYFVIGTTLGMYMGGAQDFRLRHVHVHFHLLGWVSLALMALIYRGYPGLERGWIPQAHLWLHNLGLVVMMGGISHAILSEDKYYPVIAGGSSLVSLGVALWAVHVCAGLRNVKDPL